MGDRQVPPQPRANTISLLGQAYSLLGFKIVDGVVGAGFPIKPGHSAVFAQMRPGGSRLGDLARGANMTPQSMGEIVDELERLGYVVRQPDPTDRRAKLVVLTELGERTISASQVTIQGIEERLTEILGEREHQLLRDMLGRILGSG